MKKIFLYNLLAIVAIVFFNTKASAQVSIHIGGVIGGNPAPVYRAYPVYQSYPANLPPGQAKKLYGTKSAKYFAPGHAKKARRYKHNKHRRYDKRYRRPYAKVYRTPSRPRVIIDAHVSL